MRRRAAGDHRDRRRRYATAMGCRGAIPRNLFADILRLIAELRPPPAAAPT